MFSATNALLPKEFESSEKPNRCGRGGFVTQRAFAIFVCRYVFVWLFVCGSIARGQANGNLQIHHMDVGQGDGAILISPKGQLVLFDVGEDMKRRDCTKPLSYLDQLGVKQIDYLVV